MPNSCCVQAQNRKSDESDEGSQRVSLPSPASSGQSQHSQLACRLMDLPKLQEERAAEILSQCSIERTVFSL